MTTTCCTRVYTSICQSACRSSSPFCCRASFFFDVERRKVAVELLARHQRLNTHVCMKSCLVHPTVAYLREELIAGRTTSRALVEQARCGPRTLFALALAHSPCLAAGARSNCRPAR